MKILISWVVGGWGVGGGGDSKKIVLNDKKFPFHFVFQEPCIIWLWFLVHMWKFRVCFTNIWGLCSNFVECESFLESNSPDILALCETNFNDSVNSGNFFVRGYLLLIRKDSVTHIHGLAVYVKEGLSFAWDLSLENSAYSYLCFQLALLHSVSYFFFLS